MAQHISIRVPWHDNGWDGSVCKYPSLNSSCLRLKNTSDNRDDDYEASVCQQCIAGKEDHIPCVSEGGAFMSSFDLHKNQIHPYKEGNPETHGHFRNTEVTYPAFSFPGRPYSWLMYDDRTNHTNIKAILHGINYQSNKEPDICWEGKRPLWVQEACNQKAIFDYFFHNVIPNESLCIAYAKQVPFFESGRRVVIGVGHVTKITPAIEHNHTSEGKLRSMTWETMISHSIRDDNKDGFLIPYEEMQKYADKNPDFDINTIAVYAPEEAFDEFSYATEHVKYDSVIDVLLSCIKSFTIIEERLGKDYSGVINWLKEQTNRVWRDRGLFPGLGAMFYSLGIQSGIPLGEYVRKYYNDSNEIWEFIDYAIDTPEILPRDIARFIDQTAKETWRNLPKDRKRLFMLLSRFDLDLEQAEVLFHSSERENNKIELSDTEIIENPYSIYEKTRLKNDHLYISVKQIDRAIFPNEIIRNILPLDKPSSLESPNDKRRVRALLVYVLEEAASQGHTIFPEKLALECIKNMPLDPECRVNEDIIAAMDQFFKTEVIKRNMKESGQYYKLVRIDKFDSIIKRVVTKKGEMQKIRIDIQYDDLINSIASLNNLSDEMKSFATLERTNILKMIAESHFSVLVGNAGTGKTTLLSFLCSQPDIAAGGIWLIAPTGKATVRLSEKVREKNINVNAFNAAQFLVRGGWFDKRDKRFYLKGESNPNITEQSTVIIDEASMFTVEMLGALFEAVRSAKRIILVGDPNQLPPIGAGRPFVDIIDYLKKDLPKFAQNEPVVGKCYGELKTNIRQQNQRADVVLSRRFTAVEHSEYSDDEILDIIQNNNSNIKFLKWETREDLESLLLDTTSKILGMESKEDQNGFDIATGANINSETFFNKECAEFINLWQILCPVRNMPQGVANMNRLFHAKYRSHQIELAKLTGFRHRIPAPFGSDGIVYGDKVINLKNENRDAYPSANQQNYVANGEIGIVCDCYSRRGTTSNDIVHVCFSTQKDCTYSFTKKDYNEETNDDVLELAYALTVHKAQGSQFGSVILVISEPCGLLSRELLYTALTRQENSIYVLYNQDPYNLLKYSSVAYSDIAQRFTDLFTGFKNYVPQIRKVGNSFFDEYKIHLTVEGELVQSKSEAIIANALHYNSIKYNYELPLTLGNRTIYPDFTIKDPDTGEVWYWEHCGLMSDKDYVKRWRKKEKLYAEHGITQDTNLIVTEEYRGEGLDTQEIDALIKEKFMLF